MCCASAAIAPSAPFKTHDFKSSSFVGPGAFDSCVQENTCYHLIGAQVANGLQPPDQLDKDLTGW